LLIPVISAKCPHGAYEWRSKCYYFEKKATGFPEAEEKCNSLGGHLASIHDGFTNAVVTEHARDSFGTNSTSNDFWIGLSNLITPKNLTWIDGTGFNYANWDKKQPGSITTTKCGVILLKNGLWKIDSCYKMKNFVCTVSEQNLTTTASPVTTLRTTIGNGPTGTAPPASNCTGNFTYYQPTNACYGVFGTGETDGMAWSDGENFCKTINGHLASIHSEGEYQFIMSFNYPVNAFYWPWIGLFTSDQGQTWQWSDGSATDYLPWIAGFPDTSNPYYCAFLNSEGIENLDCGDIGSTLCKINL
jgi:C-type mannose receptor